MSFAQRGERLSVEPVEGKPFHGLHALTGKHRNKRLEAISVCKVHRKALRKLEIGIILRAVYPHIHRHNCTLVDFFLFEREQVCAYF